MKILNKTKRNVVLFVMSLVLILGSIAPVSATKSGVVNSKTSTAQKYSYMKLSENYQEVATSENLTMSVDFESGLFAIKNNDNGYIWYSVPNNSEFDSYSQGIVKNFSQSLLTAGYINKVDEVESSRLYYLDSSSVVETNVTEIENGVHIDYTYEIDLTASSATYEEGSEESVVEEEEKPAELINVTIPVEFCLVDGKLSASVDIENVKKTDDIIISEYNLLPYFGAASWTENGYLFVPDGSGALINFQGHFDDASTYSQMVYGNDLALQSQLKKLNSESIRMPVFGLSNANDNAFLAIIENGAAASSIEASPVNNSKGYSTVSAKFNAKLVSQTTMFSKSSNVQTIFRLSDELKEQKEFRVDYYILDGEDANYMGMANRYRKYLEDNEVLKKSTVKPTINVDLYGAIDVKSNILGVTYDKRFALTTYSEAQKIAKSLKEGGINDLSIRYIGWGNDGVTNTNALTSAKLMKVLGNKKSFNEFTDYLKDNDVNFYPDADLIYFLKGSNNSVAKTAFGETYYKYQYLRSVYSYDLKGNMKSLSLPSKIEKNSKKYLDSYTKLGLDNISLSTVTNTVYSSLKKGKNEYRTKTADVLENVLKDYKDAKLNIVGESANAYSFKYIDKIYKAPIYCSGYSCIDSEIPFYEIVLHGYINMTGDNMVQSIDPRTTYLKCIESGIELLWLGIHDECAELRDTRYDTFYGTTYTSWQNDAVNKYKEYQPLLNKIYDKTIVNHKEVEKDVTLTEYENGIKVYVNFSNEDVNIDGLEVTANNFNYKEG